MSLISFMDSQTRENNGFIWLLVLCHQVVHAEVSNMTFEHGLKFG